MNDEQQKTEKEQGISSEQFQLWRFGIILILTSGISAILATSLQSQSVENQQSHPSELSTVQLFSTLVPSSEKYLSLNSLETQTPLQENQSFNSKQNPLISPFNPIQKEDIFLSIYLDNSDNLDSNLISVIPQENPFIPQENYPIVTPQTLTKPLSKTTLIEPFGLFQPVLTATQPLVAQTAPIIQPLPTASELPKLEGVELTLRDTIVLALENNRTIKNQYLERIVQRQELTVAEDKFNPDFTPILAIQWVNLNQGTATNTTQGLNLSARMVIKIPTGGELNLGWLGRGQQETLEGFADRNGLSQNLELSFRQPLLRGAGEKVNRASIEVARLNETINLLQLKTVLIDQITDTTFSYRQLLQAQEQVKIAQQSLAIAQQQVENTQILIEAGRLARSELIPVQTRVANQEVAVLEAFNNFKQQQLNLLELLDIDEDVDIIVSDELEITPPNFDEKTVQQLALENRPSYLTAQLAVERAKTELIVAENNRRWNIDLTAQLFHDPSSNLNDNRTDSRAGISFSKTLGDRNIELEFQRRRVDVLQAENNLTEEFQNININLEQRLQDIQDNFKKVELARRVVELTEQQLRNEEEKVKLGVQGASVVNLVDFQSQLTDARNNELNAIIEYQNALTNLAQTLGTTLEAWDVTIEPQPPQNDE